MKSPDTPGKPTTGSGQASFAVDIHPKSLLDPKAISAIVGLSKSVSADVELTISSIANIAISSLAKLPSSQLARIVVSLAARVADSAPVSISVNHIPALSKELTKMQGTVMRLRGKSEDLISAVASLKTSVAYKSLSLRGDTPAL